MFTSGNSGFLIERANMPPGSIPRKKYLFFKFSFYSGQSLADSPVKNPFVNKRIVFVQAGWGEVCPRNGKSAVSQLAWKYFKSLPESKNHTPDYHLSVSWLKGVDDNFRWFGLNWPDSRYLALTLSADAFWNHGEKAYIEWWHCSHDLKKVFFYPPLLCHCQQESTWGEMILF